MKKAGILTYYNVHNHGSSLQALGLKNVLTSMGYDVSFLSFDRNYDFIPVEKKNKYKIGLSSIPFYFKYMFQMGISNILFNLSKKHKLDTFTENNLPSGGRYSDYHGDLVVIGSDEVFSFEIGINPFFYGIGLDAKKVISYAASFGPTISEDIQKNRLGYMLKSGFESLDAISVRDNNSMRIVNEYSNKTPCLVCDPVILYGYKEEQLKYKPQNDEKYIIVYSYDKNFRDKKTIEQIKALAKKEKCRVYSVGYHHKWCDKNICPDPIEMLGLFKNSKCVFTDTFHGAVVSLITNTQFWVRLSGNQNKLRFLLSEYGLEGRIVDDFEDQNRLVNDVIDYNKVNTILENRRKASLDFLKENVG